MAGIGWFWYLEGFWTEGRTRAAASLALPDDDAVPRRLKGLAAVVGSLCAFRQGDYSEAVRLGRQTLDDAGATGDPALRSIAYCGLALGSVVEDELVPARRWADLAQRAAEESGDPWLVGAAALVAGRVALSVEDFPHALGLHTEALREMQQVGDHTSQPAAWSGMGMAHLAMGDFVAAEEALVQARRLTGDRPAADDATTALLGVVALQQGDTQRGLEMIDQGVDVIFRYRDWVGLEFARTAVVPALIAPCGTRSSWADPRSGA